MHHLAYTDATNVGTILMRHQENLKATLLLNDTNIVLAIITRIYLFIFSVKQAIKYKDYRFMKYDIDPDHIIANCFMFSLFLLVYYTLYRKHIFSIFDPLVFLVFNISTTSLLIIQENITFSWLNLLQFFLFQLMFWYGFSKNKVYIKELVKITFADNDINLLEQLTLILFAVFLAANLYLIFTVGVPILAVDPTIAKIDYFAGGLGFIRRINWGVANFTTCSAMVLSIVGTHKKTFVSIVAIQMLILALGGSKGGTILLLIFAIALLSHRYNFKDKRVMKSYSKAVYCLLPFAMVVGTLVLYVTFNDMSDAALALAFRGIMSGMLSCIIINRMCTTVLMILVLLNT